MLFLVSVALLLVAHVQADKFRGSRKIWRKDKGFGNSTVAFINTTVTSITASTSSATTSTTMLTTISSSTSNNDTSVADLSPTLSLTLSSNTTSNTPEVTCTGLVTYTGSVYPTVFITVTEGFDVTVTASNASITASETLITPLPACEATVVSAEGSFAPLEATEGTPIATIPVSTIYSAGPVEETGISSTDNWPETEASSTDTWPETETATATSTSESGSSKSAQGHPDPTPEVVTSEGMPPPPVVTPEAPSAPASSKFASILLSTIYATAPYTSTVVVTKKTPVPVVVPATSAPPVFQNPPPSTKSPVAPGTTHQNNPGNEGSTQPAANTLSRTNNSPAPPSPTPGTSTGLGSIIASIVNSPFAPPQSGQVAPATTIFNVPLGVGASSVLVGTQAVAIPTSGAATVRAGDQLFTVKPSEIVASGTTIGFASLELAQIASSIPPTRVTAAPGLVLIVQGTTAVVAGTTYRIGEGASATVVTVSGQRIQLGPSGVVLASTTVAAGAITPAPMAVESIGDLTFSVDATEVVIEGTTYRIGSGAPTIRTTVDGQSLSIGPGGVGVGSKTTLKPTTVTADSTSGAIGSAGLQTAAASHTSRIPFSEVLGWLLMTVAGLLV